MKEISAQEMEVLKKRINELFEPSKITRFQSSRSAAIFTFNKLKEMYARNENVIDWKEVFKKIQEAVLGKITKKDYDNYLDKLNIEIKIISDPDKLGGYFSLKRGKIVFEVSENVIAQIACAINLNDFVDEFWSNFVHEDTHRQQVAKSKIGISLSKSTADYWDINLGDEKDLAYFNQHEEADAYGREIGARLEKIFPQKSSGEIFDMIRDNDIYNKVIDEYTRAIINVYRDPRISNNSKRDFFNSMYYFIMKSEHSKIDDSEFFNPEDDKDRIY